MQQDATAVGPGRVLYGAREQRGMSIEDVAKALNLSPRHIAALEADDYESLSGPTYIRGYLRGYALLLGLDPDALIRSYNAVHAATQETPDLGALTPPPQASSRDGLVKLGTVVVAGLVFGLAVIWWVGRESARPGATTAVRLPAATEPSTPAGETTLPDATAIDPAAGIGPATDGGLLTAPHETLDRGTPAPPAIVIPERASPGARTPLAPPAGPADAPVTKPGTVSPAPPRVAAPPAAPAAPAPRAKLIVHTTQESWVDIRDARQGKLLYETLAAGRTVAIEGVAPLSVFIGNAEGVTVEFNGSPYDIAPFRRGQIARFSLPPVRPSGNSGLLGP